MNMKSSVFLTKKFMAYSGILPEKYIEPSLRKIYFVYRNVYAISVVAVSASLITETVRISRYPHPLERKMQALMISITGFTLIVKLLVCKMNKIPEMFEELWIMENEMPLMKNKEVQKIYQQFQRYNLLINIAIMLVTNCSVSSLMITSLINIFKTGLKNFDYQNNALFVEIYLPDIVRKEHIYIIYAGNIFIVVAGFCTNVACQVTLYTLINFVSLKFELIGFYLRTFDSFKSDPEDNPFMRLKFLIIEHQKTLKFVKDLNRAVKYLILFELLINSFNVASMGFQLLTVSNKSKFIFAAIFFSMHVIQIFVFAMTANEVQVQSIAVATMAFKCNWYKEYNKEIRQMILMIILRAQKPAVLTIGPFKPMTAQTALMVMKAAYSYATMMMHSFK